MKPEILAMAMILIFQWNLTAKAALADCHSIPEKEIVARAPVEAMNALLNQVERYVEAVNLTDAEERDMNLIPAHSKGGCGAWRNMRGDIPEMKRRLTTITKAAGDSRALSNYKTCFEEFPRIFSNTLARIEWLERVLGRTCLGN